MKRSLALASAVLALFSVNARAADDVIRVGNLKLAHFGAISYMEEIAPSCGLKIQLKIFAKGLDIMQAIIAGELDAGASASEAAISGRAAGTAINVVAGFAKGGARLVASPESGIKTIADLKGKKVGVTRGGIQEVLLAAVLGAAGITSSDQAGKDVQIIFLSFPDLNQALLNKQIDAMMQTEPQSSQAIGNKFGVEVMKPYDTPIGSPVRTLVMTEKYIKENPVASQKFLNCFVKATKTFMDEPATAEKFVTQSLFKGQVTSADFQAAIGNSPYAMDITPEHIQITTDTMHKYGIGRMANPPKAVDWVKTDMLKKAKEAAGIK
ncbi:MAG: ABC transporter substrate-binding protein [Hyphomicrobiaceae bacterium]